MKGDIQSQLVCLLKLRGLGQSPISANLFVRLPIPKQSTLMFEFFAASGSPPKRKQFHSNFQVFRAKKAKALSRVVFDGTQNQIHASDSESADRSKTYPQGEMDSAYSMSFSVTRATNNFP